MKKKKNLILLHGALGHSDQFNQLAKNIGHDYHIHQLLFKGHGEDTSTKDSFYIDDLVEQLQQFIEQNEIKNPSVFGYSLGGYVALCHALKYPGIIASLLTLATKLEWSPEIAEQEVRLLNPDVILEKVPKYAAHLEKVHGENWKNLLKQTADLMIDIGDNRYLNENTLSKITIPVQLMVGDQDKQVSIRESRLAFEQMSNSKLAIFANTEHAFEKVNEGTIVEHIYNFLKN